MFVETAARLAGLSGALLGWRPHEFWAATPAELATVIEALAQRDPQVTPPTQSDLKSLMELFPDG